jgi:hypothetical protein
MKMRILVKVLFILLFLTACTPNSSTVPSPTSTDVVLHVAKKISSTVLPNQTMDELRNIIYASNPESPQYDPKSSLFAEFPQAVKQLAMMGPKAVDAAGDLANAITYPRPDAYLAAQALITLGSDITGTTIVTLFGNLDPGNLHNLKPEAVIYSTILLSTTGNKATCAVGNIGPLLWNNDPVVRYAAAYALKMITAQAMAANPDKIVITPSFRADSIPADYPEGSIVGAARAWWNSQGSKINWHSSYGFCDP